MSDVSRPDGQDQPQDPRWPEVTPVPTTPATPPEPYVIPEVEDFPFDEGPAPFSETPRPILAGRRPGGPRRLAKPTAEPRPPMTGEQRLLLLDTWRRSNLPAADFAALVGLSKHSLYAWKKAFEEAGPAGLMPHPRGSKKGSRLGDGHGIIVGGSFLIVN